MLFTLLLISAASDLSAQEQPNPVKNPPVNVETLFSNRGVAFQMMVNKKMQSIPRLGFFSVTTLVGEWDQQAVKDFMSQGNLTFQIVEGLDVLGGFHVTNASGFRPTAGLMYSYKQQDFMFVINTRADLISNGVIEGLTILEYQPEISEQWRLYTRLQGLYGHTLNADTHARSYVIARAGLSYREFTFGLGTNLDWYGPVKQNINSYGAFFSMSLF